MLAAVATGLRQPRAHSGMSQGHSVSVMPCSQALLCGIENIGATDGNQKNEVLASTTSWTGPEMGACGKLTRMKAAA